MGMSRNIKVIIEALSTIGYDPRAYVEKLILVRSAHPRSLHPSGESAFKGSIGENLTLGAQAKSAAIGRIAAPLFVMSAIAHRS